MECEEGEEDEEGQCTTWCSCEEIVIGASLVYTIFLELESHPIFFIYFYYIHLTLDQGEIHRLWSSFGIHIQL